MISRAAGVTGASLISAKVYFQCRKEAVSDIVVAPTLTTAGEFRDALKRSTRERERDGASEAEKERVVTIQWRYDRL